MKTTVIINPTAGSAAKASTIREYARTKQWTVIEAQTSAAMRTECRQALSKNVERIIACGGDGTIHEVVQAMAHRWEQAKLAVIPLGTGNDLARALRVPFEAHEALRLAEVGREHLVDILQVDNGDVPQYCVNVSAGGFSARVDEELTDRMKSVWGRAAYIASAAKAVPALSTYQVALSLDRRAPLEIVEALAVIVANGPTCAGGLQVASGARLDDGLMDIVVVKSGSFVDLAGLAMRLASGTLLEDDDVQHWRAREVAIRSEPEMAFNMDGELTAHTPLRVHLLAKQLRIVVGDGFGRSR